MANVYSLQLSITICKPNTEGYELKMCVFELISIMWPVAGFKPGIISVTNALCQLC